MRESARESARASARERERGRDYREQYSTCTNGVQGEGEWRYEGQEGKEEVVEEEEEDAEEKEKEEISYVARLEGAVVVAVSGFYFSPFK
jgi:ABC-type transport system involved in cytochrome bd biosynthesis fused ATPase/permease subunit